MSLGGDTGRDRDPTRHWHLHIIETAFHITDPGKPPPVDLDRPPDATAHSPDEVLAWFRQQADQLRPRAVDRYVQQVDGLFGDEITDIRRAALTWGKGTGAGFRLSDGLMVGMYAQSAGQPVHLDGDVTLHPDVACTHAHSH